MKNFRSAIILLALLFNINHYSILAQPDSATFFRALSEISDGYVTAVHSKIPRYQYVRLNSNPKEQCVNISNVLIGGKKKKILIYWQKDQHGKWNNVYYIIAERFKFRDIDHNGIMEIECLDKSSDKNRRDYYYSLLSFDHDAQTIMYNYHQYEYFNTNYIMNNIPPDSVFAIKHKLLFKDIDEDGKPEITDHIQIRYRKLPCCEHHFEYGIRQKKLVLHLINGKFESD